jgi:dynein light chain roadblock-type
VLGVLLLSRASPPAIIRHSGVVFDGEQGRKYAKAVGRIVDVTKAGLDEVDIDSVSLLNVLRFSTHTHSRGSKTI